MNGHELNTNSKGAALADRRTPQTETESSVGNSCSSVSVHESFARPLPGIQTLRL